MARGPDGECRPTDVIDSAVTVMRIATSEEPEDYGLRGPTKVRTLPA